MASLASLAPAMPGRVTPSQDLHIESQGAASAFVEMSAPTVRRLFSYQGLLPACLIEYQSLSSLGRILSLHPPPVCLLAGAWPYDIDRGRGPRGHPDGGEQG
jgi:hypothetical protein